MLVHPHQWSLYQFEGKRPNILMEMCRHFIWGNVYMTFYHPKWNFIFVKMADMKSILALCFKRTSTLNATFNQSALIHFVSGKLCSHENLMPVWNFISVKISDMKSIPFWVHFASHVNAVLRGSWWFKKNIKMFCFGFQTAGN